MKKFVTGFIVGAIICSMLGAFAVSYVAEPVTFKVMVNGKEFVSESPALAINGSTYLPLKATGEALGVPVVWNQDKFQVEVGKNESETKEITSGYKTYAENKNVIDFGDFCGVSPCEDVMVIDGDASYWYDYSTSDKVMDYIDKMEENGYKLADMKKDTFFTSCYLKNTNGKEDPGFVISFGQPSMSSLDMYVIITIYK